MKKKFGILFALILTIILSLSACTGDVIVYTNGYDMNIGYKPCPQKEITFNIASYNIQGGKLTNEKVLAIRELLKSENIDVAGLQEMDHLSNRTGKANFLKQFTQDFFNHNYYAPTNTIIMKETYGVATLSKTSFEETFAFLLPYPYEREIADVEKRIVTRNLTTIDGVQIALYNTHLSFEDIEMNNKKSLRQAQIEYLISLLNSDPVPFKILTGDFNVNSFKEYSAFIDAGYKTINNAQNIYPTFRENIDFASIDNIIYSPNLILTLSKMIDVDYSDHNPIIATFKTSY